MPFLTPKFLFENSSFWPNEAKLQIVVIFYSLNIFYHIHMICILGLLASKVRIKRFLPKLAFFHRGAGGAH